MNEMASPKSPVALSAEKPLAPDLFEASIRAVGA